MPVASYQNSPDDIHVSVVFATRNRAHQLKHTLAAYRALDTANLQWELVVIDNNSTDDTATVLTEAANDLPMRRLFVTESGQNRARNKALPILRGRLLVFTDDDVLPHPDCLKAYLDAALRWPEEIIFGARIDPKFPTSAPTWLKDPEFDFSTTAFARYAPAESEGRVKRHPYGPSFAVRRDALKHHRFPIHLGPQRGAYAMGGEGEFLRRIAANKYSYVYVPSARVQHVVRPEQVTADWLFQRAQKKGRGQVYLPTAKKHRRLFIHGVHGVPARLWLATGRAWVRYRLSSLLGGTQTHVRQGIKFQLRWGQVQELRQQHHQTRLLPEKEQ